MTERYPRLILPLLTCLAIFMGGCRSVSVPPSVTGRAIYMLSVTLPESALVEFKLVKTTVSGEVIETVSEQTLTGVRRAPIMFDLPYRPSEIRSRDFYGVTCIISAGDRVLFRTARPFPVLTHGAGKQVEVLLERVR